MPMPANHAAVRDWLKALGSLTAGSLPAAEADRKLGAYAPLLAADYPATAFCPGSLAAVARQCRFFPAYAELCEHLDAWSRDNRPPQIEAPPTTDPWAERVDRERAEAAADWADPAKVRASIRSLIDHPMRATLGPMLAALVGRHAPANVALLPQEWQTAGPDTPRDHDARPAVRASPLTPEQLQALKDHAA
jgi:hypothetical protein